MWMTPLSSQQVLCPIPSFTLTVDPLTQALVQKDRWATHKQVITQSIHKEAAQKVHTGVIYLQTCSRPLSAW